MTFSIDKKIFELFPNYVVAVVVGKNLNNDGTSEKISQLLNEATAKVKQQFQTQEDIANNPNIKIWRNSFTKLGLNPKNFSSSIDAMVTRIFKKGDFPSINKIVDLGNIVALNNLVPVGAHDIDRMSGEIKIF